MPQRNSRENSAGVHCRQWRYCWTSSRLLAEFLENKCGTTRIYAADEKAANMTRSFVKYAHGTILSHDLMIILLNVKTNWYNWALQEQKNYNHLSLIDWLIDWNQQKFKKIQFVWSFHFLKIFSQFFDLPIVFWNKIRGLFRKMMIFFGCRTSDHHSQSRWKNRDGNLFFL